MGSQADIDRAEQQAAKLQRKINWKTSNALLARLLLYHGDNPPDAETAEAAAYYRRAGILGEPNEQQKQERERLERIHQDDIRARETRCVREQTIRLYSNWGAKHQIIAEVASKHGLSIKEISQKSRRHKIVHPRHEAVWRCVNETDDSYSEIARFFGYTDHTSVIHAWHAHENKVRGTNRDYRGRKSGLRGPIRTRAAA